MAQAILATLLVVFSITLLPGSVAAQPVLEDEFFLEQGPVPAYPGKVESNSESLVHNGSEYVAFWVTRPATASASEIRATRISADGEVLDHGGKLIAACGSRCGKPQVEYLPGLREYMVVWQTGGDAPTQPSDIDGISVDENLVPGTRFTVAGTVGWEGNPTLAMVDDPLVRGFMAVYERYDATSQAYETVLAFINKHGLGDTVVLKDDSGVPIRGRQLHLDGDWLRAGYLWLTGVLPSGDVFVLAHEWKYTSYLNLWRRFYIPSLNPAGPQGRNPRVAWRPNGEVNVFWEEDAMFPRVMGVELAVDPHPTPTPVVGPVVTVSGSTFTNSRTNLTTLGRGAVAWREGRDLYAASMTNGQVTWRQRYTRFLEQGAPFTSTLASAEGMLLWTRDDGPPGHAGVVARRHFWGADTGNIVVASSATAQSLVRTEPAVAYDASLQEFLTVWNAGGSIYGMVGDQYGRPAGSPFLLGDAFAAAKPSVAASGGGTFFVVWEMEGGNAFAPAKSVIRGAVVSGGGVIHGNSFVSTNLGYQFIARSPAVTFLEDHFMVVWSEYDDHVGSSDIWGGWFLEEQLHVGITPEWVERLTHTAGANETNPVVAGTADGARSIVAYEAMGTTAVDEEMVYVEVFDQSNSLTGPANMAEVGVAMAEALGLELEDMAQLKPAVASHRDTNRFLITFAARELGGLNPTDLHGVLLEGDALDPVNYFVHADNGAQEHPAVCAEEDRFVAVFEDDSSTSWMELDLDANLVHVGELSALASRPAVACTGAPGALTAEFFSVHEKPEAGIRKIAGRRALSPP